MTSDFSGYATKNNLKCSDGRTIMPGAFKHHDQQRVPLVWQHQHNDPSNVLGHAMLEHRPDGVYAYGFFNDTDAGKNAKTLVKHQDVVALSIYANNLSQQGGAVLHGDIREVSLVLSGANPGALIDNINIQHADGEISELEDEAVIYTGLPLEHEEEPVAIAKHAEDATTNETLGDVFETLTEKQQKVVFFMIASAVEEALDDVEDDSAAQSSISQNDDTVQHSQEANTMSRNVFDQTDSKTQERPTLTHDQLKTIVDDAKNFGGSFKESLLAHATNYGIDNIDVLFPDAKAIATAPEVIGRRTEWVSEVITGTKHSPFSRIKSTAVDLTADEARAKGYVKGNLKKDEIIRLLKRVTTPTTIYKKQKLDRDDILDITDLDVVAWLKAEMRLMLDEELARAVLIGDGRDSDNEDKINTDHIRPIAYDADMYAHQLTIASDVGPDAIIESILRARTYYKGTGTPTLYTTDGVLTDLILVEDKVGRRKYETEEALAAALRVRKIVTVEAMDAAPDVVAILVNLADYTLGADRGGNIAMFDDFDIDYNQYKYLIETRVSGALTKPKSALVIKRTLGITVTPSSPSFDGATNTITIPAQTGVVYSINGTDVTGNVVITETTEVDARPAPGYSFPANTVTNWTFVYTP